MLTTHLLAMNVDLMLSNSKILQGLQINGNNISQNIKTVR